MHPTGYPFGIEQPTWNEMALLNGKKFVARGTYLVESTVEGTVHLSQRDCKAVSSLIKN